MTRKRYRHNRRVKTVKASIIISFGLISLIAILGIAIGLSRFTPLAQQSELESDHVYKKPQAYIEITPRECPLSDVHLVIDPGHGGMDSGAVGILNGESVHESHLVLDVSFRLRELLEPTGMQITMTRVTDVFVSIADREAMTDEVNADLFVSIHLNSHENPTSHGIEVIYFGEESHLLAEKLQGRLVEKLQLRDRGVVSLNAISEANRPIVITEAGFISNPEELALLASEEGLQLHAEALYLGILDYLAARGYDISREWCD